MAAFACAAGLAAAACGGSGGDGAAPGDDAVSAPATAAANDEVATPVDGAVPAALQFTAPLIGGGEIDATELAGKPTAFWFWSPT